MLFYIIVNEHCTREETVTVFMWCIDSTLRSEFNVCIRDTEVRCIRETRIVVLTGNIKECRFKVWEILKDLICGTDLLNIVAEFMSVMINKVFILHPAKYFRNEIREVVFSDRSHE